MSVSRYLQEKLGSPWVWRRMAPGAWIARRAASRRWRAGSTRGRATSRGSACCLRGRETGRVGSCISRGWVEESSAQTREQTLRLEYQYFWWVDTPDDKTLHFSARGKYGQYIYVAPEKDLVIVRLGKAEGEKGYDYWIDLF